MESGGSYHETFFDSGAYSMKFIHLTRSSLRCLRLRPSAEVMRSKFNDWLFRERMHKQLPNKNTCNETSHQSIAIAWFTYLIGIVQVFFSLFIFIHISTNTDTSYIRCSIFCGSLTTRVIVSNRWIIIIQVFALAIWFLPFLLLQTTVYHTPNDQFDTRLIKWLIGFTIGIFISAQMFRQISMTTKFLVLRASWWTL